MLSVFCSVCAPGSSEAKHGGLFLFTNHGHKIRQQRCVQGMSVWLTLTYEKGVGHGRMGYRGVYGRVMWTWFASGLEGQRNEFYGSAVTLCEMGH